MEMTTSSSKVFWNICELDDFLFSCVRSLSGQEQFQELVFCLEKLLKLHQPMGLSIFSHLPTSTILQVTLVPFRGRIPLPYCRRRRGCYYIVSNCRSEWLGAFLTAPNTDTF